MALPHGTGSCILLHLLASAALLTSACDLPISTCACANCRVYTLGWARIPANVQGLGSYFHFGLSLNFSNPKRIVTGAYLGNRNYEYIYVNSTSSPLGSNQTGKSVSENLVSDADVLNAPGPPLAVINDVDTCCAKCAVTATCLYYLFYPLDAVTLVGLYAAEEATPIVGSGKRADPFLYPFAFRTEKLGALPGGVATQCVLLTLRPQPGARGHTFKPNQYAFDGDARPRQGAANPKAIIGGTCNSNPPSNPCR